MNYLRDSVIETSLSWREAVRSISPHYKNKTNPPNFLVVKTLESPVDNEEIKPVNAKGNPDYSLAGLMLMLKLQYFGQRADSVEKTLMLGKTGGRG